MKNLKLFLFVSFFLTSLCSNCQTLTLPQNEDEQNQSDSLSQSILGTWKPKAEAFDYRWDYHTDGTLTMYDGNDPSKTYNWLIVTQTTSSGLLSSKLKITNVLNTEDCFNYEIDTLSDETLILVFNNGVGFSRNTFIKQ